MHHGLSAHRDRVVEPGARRPSLERDADEFAAHLLMPAKLLCPIFLRYFGTEIDSASIDSDLAFRVSNSSGTLVDVSTLLRQTPIQRASLFAGLCEFAGSMFEPLNRRFGVSRRAMAIQLVELGLVS
jgi:Zn-dependent peptidase ImmA (M78 family)